MRIIDFPLIYFNTFSERLDILVGGVFAHWKWQSLEPHEVAEGRLYVAVAV
jgi:hypothetical protein